MSADGSRNRFLVKGSGARWSPSGDRIAYTATGEPKGSQVFVMRTQLYLRYWFDKYKRGGATRTTTTVADGR